jgi:hypothetical protein
MNQIARKINCDYFLLVRANGLIVITSETMIAPFESAQAKRLAGSDSRLAYLPQ